MTNNPITTLIMLLALFVLLAGTTILGVLVWDLFFSKDEDLRRVVSDACKCEALSCKGCGELKKYHEKFSQTRLNLWRGC